MRGQSATAPLYSNFYPNDHAAPEDVLAAKSVPDPGRPLIGGERIFIELVTSDRKLKASREGSK